MKRDAILIILLFFAFGVNAQSFLSENKLYTMAYDMQVMGKNPEGYYWKIGGDTIIQDRTYKKTVECSKKDMSEWNLSYILREDSNKVYRFNNGSEILIYDFNLNVLDTFKYRSVQLVVDSIKIKKWGSMDKKHFYFHAIYNNSVILNHQEIWIEGIGNIEDPAIPTQLMLTGGYTFMVCYEENSTPIYHNPKYTSCFITSKSEISEAAQSVWVNQSPNGNLLIVNNGADYSGGKFTLLSPEGKVVQSMMLKVVQSEICPPGTGLYLYRFEAENGQVQTGKVLVK